MKRELVAEGGTIIEPTAGNTGIGLALAAIRYMIYTLLFVFLRSLVLKNKILMKALGAKIVHTPTEIGMTGAIAKAKELVNEIPNSYCPNQFANEANPVLIIKR